MSDESQPEPLRLKPRAQTGTGQPPAAAAPSAAEAAATEAPRLRLKPRLTESTGDAQGETATPDAAPEPLPPAQELPRLRPKLAVEPETTPTAAPAPEAEAPGAGLNLKPKLRLSPDSSAAAAPGGGETEVSEPRPTAESVLPTAAGSTLPATVPPIEPGSLPKPPPPRTAPPPPPPAASATKRTKPPRRIQAPEHGPVFKTMVAVMGILIAGLLGVGGYFVYVAVSDAPPAQPVATRSAPPAPVQARPAAPAASLAGKMVEKAKEAVAAHDRANAQGMAGVLDEEPAPPVATSAGPTTVTSAPPPLSETAATVTAASESGSVPSQAFRDWVNQARVSGVRGGAEARAFINDRVVRRGETVEQGLGITFDGVNTAQGLVLFKDRTGAVVGKKF
jgi:hypothetical protein